MGKKVLFLCFYLFMVLMIPFVSTADEAPAANTNLLACSTAHDCEVTYGSCNEPIAIAKKTKLLWKEWSAKNLSLCASPEQWCGGCAKVCSEWKAAADSHIQCENSKCALNLPMASDFKYCETQNADHAKPQRERISILRGRGDF